MTKSAHSLLTLTYLLKNPQSAKTPNARLFVDFFTHIRKTEQKNFTQDDLIFFWTELQTFINEYTYGKTIGARQFNAYPMVSLKIISYTCTGCKGRDDHMPNQKEWDYSSPISPYQLLSMLVSFLKTHTTPVLFDGKNSNYDASKTGVMITLLYP
jgi:hypothetical protein